MPTYNRHKPLLSKLAQSPENGFPGFFMPACRQIYLYCHFFDLRPPLNQISENACMLWLTEISALFHDGINFALNSTIEKQKATARLDRNLTLDIYWSDQPEMRRCIFDLRSK
jgi:hypothetical protein